MAMFLLAGAVGRVITCVEEEDGKQVPFHLSRRFLLDRKSAEDL
jgi:hypothetical protein